MRILVVGGSGHVGTLVLPYLAERHTVRVFDLRPPADGSYDYVAGDVTDPSALRQAVPGHDALLYVALGPHEVSDGGAWANDATVSGCFDVSVKGLYLALRAAHEGGVPHVVSASSMSVYRALEWRSGETRYFDDEDLPPDARRVYGFTKRLGEEVCRNACREWGLSVNALRLCLPMTAEKWRAETAGGRPTIATTAEDTARALLAALEFRCGFQAFTISGDYAETRMRLTKAKTLLGWEPRARPDTGEDAPNREAPSTP